MLFMRWNTHPQFDKGEVLWELDLFREGMGCVEGAEQSQYAKRGAAFSTSFHPPVFLEYRGWLLFAA